MHKLVLLLFLSALLPACGLKGPLYLPAPGSGPAAAKTDVPLPADEKSPPASRKVP